MLQTVDLYKSECKMLSVEILVLVFAWEGPRAQLPFLPRLCSSSAVKQQGQVTGKWLGDSFIEYFYITKASLEIATYLCSFHKEKQKAASSR